MNPIAQRILKRLRRTASIGDATLPDEFVWPAYDGYSLANVASTVLRHFGIGGIGAPGLAEEVLGGELDGAEKLVITLVDALGFLTLTQAMESGRVPGFQALAERGRFVPLTSVYPPTGTARSAYFHVRDGAVTDVKSALESGLAGAACIVETPRALADGLWGNGPRAPELPGRIGDVLALMCGSTTLFHAYSDDAVPSDIAGGRHGGLHEREMLIPFFIAGLGVRG